MADWAEEWAAKIARSASEAADAPFYEREVVLAAPVIAQALRAARAEGIEAAAKVAEKYDPDFSRTNSMLDDLATAIRALLTKESDDA